VAPDASSAAARRAALTGRAHALVDEHTADGDADRSYHDGARGHAQRGSASAASGGGRAPAAHGLCSTNPLLVGVMLDVLPDQVHNERSTVGCGPN
jgi:hypothetical protein